MNTLKRKLTAILLTFAMLFSLMPAFPQAAEAALDKTTVNNDAIQVEYTANGAFNSTVEVMVQDEEGNPLAQEPLILKNIVSGAPYNVTITALDNNYYVANVETTSGSVTIPSYDYDNSNMSFNWARMDDGSRVIVTLSKKIDPDSVNIDNWVEGGVTRNYYIYQDQLLKMIALNDPELQANIKNLDIRGIKIKPNWVQPFQVAEGTGSDKEFRQVDTLASQDRAYWDLLRVTTDNGDVGKVQPDRIKSLTITYNYGGEDKVITVPSSDLHYYANSVDQSYTIECEAPDKSIVVFYDRPNGAAARDYSLYDIRLVDTGDAIGTLPPDPVYAQGTYYKFVNWEYDNWSGEGLPFLSTTIVNDDINVFSHKVSTSELGGTQIRVLNDDDQLLNRIVELYNADTTHEPISKENIDLGTVSIRAYDADTQTDEDYLDNGWESDYEYFQIRNYAAVGNEHVSFDGLQGIYVYFELVGQDTKNTVQLTVGEQVGDLAKLMIGPENETILQLRVNQPGEVIDDGEEEPDPQPPANPTYEELKALIDVTVDCSTNEHGPKTTKLIANAAEQNDSYTVTVTGKTATVTVHNGPYVAWYNEQCEGISHSLAEEEEQNKTVKLTYDKDNGWKLADIDDTSTMVHFDVVCSGTTPEPGEDITGLTKALVSTADDAEAAVSTSKGYAFPEKGVVVIPNGGTVKLLYSITVEGTANTTFTVTDTGAELVEVEGIDVADGSDPDTFTGTIPSSGTITFYVSKIFNGDSIKDGNLINTASILEGQGDDTEDTDIDDSVVNTPAEEEPALPGEEWLNERFNVELDCTSNVGHKNKTYNNLLNNSYSFENLTYVGEDYFTVDLIVNSEQYIDDFDERTSATHQNDGEATKTIELTYKDNAWTAPENSSPIEFNVKCSGTGEYDINDIAKDLIAGETDKAAAQANGVTDFDGLTIPEKDETVIIPAGGSVTLLYSITVEGKANVEFDVTDDDTTLVPSKAAVTRNEDGTYSGMIPESGSVTFYVSKTFTGDDLEDGKLVNHASVDGADDETTVDPDPDVDEEVEAVEAVGITPADITIYEGGNGYGGVLGADGNIIAETKSSGLPEPGYFITLPDDVQKWLQEQSSEIGAEDLSQNMTFTYEGADGITTRTWELVYHGVYETDENGAPLRYVYGLTPAEVDGKEIPVRLNYFDDKNGNGKAEDDEIITSDAIAMSEDLASDTFQMTINPGELDQSQIQATFKVGEETKEYPITIGTGTLTVKSVVDEEAATNAIATDKNGVASDTLTAVADDDIAYFVNDSEVKIDDADRVELLVDEVSNSDEFNKEMGQDAIETVEGDASTHSYKLAYMDLVDVNNGNAEVTLGEGDSLTIYWPMPEDADENGDFQVVHYTGMDREETVDDLDAVTTERPEVTKVTINDQDYLTFTTTGFSPFALVYEKANGGQNPGDNDPWYPWHPGGSGDGPDGLNTEEHFSYVVGYEDGMVKPQRSITRAEVATIFYRLLEDDVRDDYDTTRNNFSDVTSDSWYNQTVSTLASMGILKGYEDGTFRPNASITRAEFAAIATRFFEETGATYEPGTFTDVTGSEWFAGAIMDAVNLGLIGGYEDGTVRPNNNITRAEACAIVNRTLGRVPDADHLLPADEMTTWPDNPSSAWFYADMQEATNGHEYEWITEDGNKIEEWTDILDKDWNDR